MTTTHFIIDEKLVLCQLNIIIMRFRDFLESDASMGEEKRDILRTLSKLPPSHRSLIKDFSWKFQGGNTLNGDDQHVGYMDDHEKEIAVAAPWNYGREFTVLHEIAHTIWERLPDQLKHHWVGIVQRTKHKQRQSPEELFCMAYANFYAKNKIVIHDHPEWNQFIKSLPQ